MNIINLKTDQLIPYVNNPRHNEDAVDASWPASSWEGRRDC